MPGWSVNVGSIAVYANNMYKKIQIEQIDICGDIVGHPFRRTPSSQERMSRTVDEATHGFYLAYLISML